jgi:hypothetical protein
LGKSCLFIFILLSGFCVVTSAQSDTAIAPLVTDTVVVKHEFYSPARAAMLSAAFPGLGQIYNKKYWKLPIVYGLVAASIYYYGYNNDLYKFWREGYYDARAGFFNEEVIERYAENGIVLPDAPTETYIESFRNSKERARKRRESSIMYIAGIYLLNIVDANVDAYFLNFNVNKDLTVQLKPFVENSLLSENIFGLKLSLDYK